MEIIWTANSKITFYELVDYFGQYWEEKQYLNFKQRVLQLLNNISKNPEMFKIYNNGVRVAVWLEKISLFYVVKNDKIYLITLWHNRQSLNTLMLPKN